MSPRGEFWLPRETSREAVQGSIESLGGRLTNYTEVKPVKPKGISSNALVAFLKDQNPDLKLPETDFYTLLSPLGQLPPAEQRRLLLSFFQEGVENFPNPQQAAETLVEIKNIPYFQPEEEPNLPQLQDLVNEFSIRLNEPSAPVRIVRDNWLKEVQSLKTLVGMEWLAAIRIAKEIAEKAGRTEAFARIGEVAETEAQMAAKEALRTNEWILTLASPEAARLAADKRFNATGFKDLWMYLAYSKPAPIGKLYAQWAIVEDLMEQMEYNKGNFLEPLMGVWKQGYWPMGKIQNKEGQEEFVIFVPPIPKSA